MTEMDKRIYRLTLFDVGKIEESSSNYFYITKKPINSMGRLAHYKSIKNNFVMINGTAALRKSINSNVMPDDINLPRKTAEAYERRV